ncbi:reverse gyrase [Candidatus Woesearchaeota archaeon]|nr:reverse gyrase [Candidatus Woesearchaeota archaeon]
MRFDSELGVLTVTVIDSVAYMQGSGRCSRLFVQGLTKGASFLLVDDERSFQLLQDKLSFFEVDFKEFSTINLDLLKQEILNHRLLVRKALKHELSMRKEFFKTGLMIVESPTKAKTIARFFGKPSTRRVNNVTVYEVNTGKHLLNIVASLGHVLDLSELDGFDGVLLQDQGLTPVYSVIAKCEGCGKQFTEAFQELHACKDKKVVSKRGIINTLRLLSYESNIVLIATDPDVEGEKIAWDIQCLVKPFNENIYRVTFHEVTRKAIVKSLEQLSSLDLNLVKAQIVRRVSDRWVGFELSKQLWRVFKNTNLSAGRVQTPVLGWIIQRTAQSRIKKPALLVDLNVNGSVVRVLFKDIAKNKFRFGSNLSCRITSKLVEQELKPEPPFCTETLLQAASRLGFSAQQVMSIAQDLFENGLITYHRTDSVRVSTQGVEIAKKWFSSKKLDFFHARTFETNSQGAHECIRPTKPLSVEELSLMIKTGAFKPVAKLSKQHLLVYDLIFKRFMSSQSENAKVVKQLLHFKLLQGNELVSTAEQERIIKIIRKSFLTFSKTQALAQVPEGVYPVTSFKMLRISVVKPYSQAELIQEMKSKHLGRPSTYAKIIETLLQRGYVVFKSLQQHVKKQKSLFLISTKKGVLVYKFLTKHFSSFVSEEFSRELEKQMDSVESGMLDHEQVLISLYQKLRIIANDSRTRGDSNPGSAG